MFAMPKSKYHVSKM